MCLQNCLIEFLVFICIIRDSFDAPSLSLFDTNIQKLKEAFIRIIMCFVIFRHYARRKNVSFSTFFSVQVQET